MEPFDIKTRNNNYHCYKFLYHDIRKVIQEHPNDASKGSICLYMRTVVRENAILDTLPGSMFVDCIKDWTVMRDLTHSDSGYLAFNDGYTPFWLVNVLVFTPETCTWSNDDLRYLKYMFYSEVREANGYNLVNISRPVFDNQNVISSDEMVEINSFLEAAADWLDSNGHRQILR